ncbi:antitoxin Xre/MbcA/ParS toxin-binding domain-containing protein [Pseudomonas chlororaphis]
MNESKRWTVKCQDTADGSGDVIVNLPPELLTKVGLDIGDALTLEVVDGVIVLRPLRSSSPGRLWLAEALRDEAYRAYRNRLETFLHIPTDATDQTIHEMIEAGLSASSIKTLCDLGTLSPEERDRIIPLKTLKTKLVSNQRLTVDESDRLFRTAHIIAMAEVLFGDAEKAKHWLSKPKSRFSGKSPNAMLSTTQGTHRVEELLIQAAEGMTF